MADALYIPKSPFPLYLADLERDTAGWDAAERYHYLCLCNHLWSVGGFIEDNDEDLADIMGINRARNWKAKIAKIRTKLLVASDIVFAEKRARIGRENEFLADFLFRFSTRGNWLSLPEAGAA